MSSTSVIPVPRFLARRAMRRILIAVNANEVPSTRDVYVLARFVADAPDQQTTTQPEDRQK
jgi:hypothetical protein